MAMRCTASTGHSAALKSSVVHACGVYSCKDAALARGGDVAVVAGADNALDGVVVALVAVDDANSRVDFAADATEDA